MVFVDFYPYVPPSVWMRVRPDAITVWDDEDVRRRLDWYYRVMTNEAPAKFLIAKIVDASENPAKLDLNGLWDLHHHLSNEHRKLWEKAIREKLGPKEVLNDKSRPEYNLLHVKVEIAKRVLRSCRFCERKCGVDRYRRIGGCFLDQRTYVHSWFHHLGEEAPLVPSGTIFYGGCNFRCVYCQNYDISQTAPRSGVIVSARQLAQIQRELRAHGARNINHVGGDPTPNIHTILESLLYLEVNVPQLWNSNMYLSLEGIELIKDVIDIWLPDFKYGNNKCATRLSAAPRYFEVVTRNLKIAVENGDMIIRHLVLPDHLECCTKPVLRWIAENLPRDRVLVNIMDQYRPEHLVTKYPHMWPELRRRPSASEVAEAFEYARKLGLRYEPVS